MNHFSVVPFWDGPAARLYTVRFHERSERELDRFLDREDSTVCSKEERDRCKQCRHRCRRYEFLTRLAENLQLSITEAGFRADFFRPLEHYTAPTAAYYAGTYRVYGVRFGPEIGEAGPSLFIAGDGGVKLVQKIKEDPVLEGRYNDVRHVARCLSKRLEERGLTEPPLDKDGRMWLPDDFLNY